LDTLFEAPYQLQFNPPLRHQTDNTVFEQKKRARVFARANICEFLIDIQNGFV